MTIPPITPVGLGLGAATIGLENSAEVDSTWSLMDEPANIVMVTALNTR